MSVGQRRSVSISTFICVMALASFAAAAGEEAQPLRTKPGLRPTDEALPRLALPAPTPPSCIKQVYDSSTFLVAQPVAPTHYFSLTSSTFVRVGNSVYSDEFSMTAQETGVTAAADFAFAPINLPHGATIREITVPLYDSSGKIDLQVSLSRRMDDLPQRGARLLTLESACILVNNVSAMRVPNLAIPFDARYAYVLKFAVVPSQTPTSSLPPSPVVSVFEVRVGYTMP